MTKDIQQIRQDIDSRVLLYSQMKQSGADPSLLFEILEGIIQRRDWEVLLDGNGVPVGSFRRFIESPPPAGCGMPAEKLMKLLQLEHRYETDGDYRERMAILRDEVAHLLNLDLPAIGSQGRPNLSENIIYNDLKPAQQGTSREYLISRLKRDNPELAERVIRGELSANRAALEAGIRKERIMVPNHDMELAAKALIAKLSAEQIEELVGILALYLNDGKQ